MFWGMNIMKKPKMQILFAISIIIISFLPVITNGDKVIPYSNCWRGMLKR